jgi:hypothetical protein
MKRYGNPLCLAAAGAILLWPGIAAIPARAEVGPSNFDAVVPCEAFQRWGNGGWTAIAPVTLHIDNGMVIGFRPGQSMAPGSTIAGVAVPVILNRHCGNI